MRDSNFDDAKIALAYALAVRDRTIYANYAYSQALRALDYHVNKLIDALFNPDLTESAKQAAVSSFSKFLVEETVSLGMKYGKAIANVYNIVNNFPIDVLVNGVQVAIANFVRELTRLISEALEEERDDKKLLALGASIFSAAAVVGGAAAGLSASAYNSGVGKRHLIDILDASTDKFAKKIVKKLAEFGDGAGVNEALQRDILTSGRYSQERTDVWSIFADKGVSKQKFVYVHTEGLIGICPKCLPHVGKITWGDGSDGVPVPPLHPNCRCILIPYIDESATPDAVHPTRTLEKVASKSPEILRHIIGPVRAKLVVSGEVNIRDLFDQNMMRMKKLSELGYSESGVKLR